MSTSSGRAEAAAAAAPAARRFIPIPSWHRADGLAALLAARTATAIDALDREGTRARAGPLHRAQPPAPVAGGRRSLPGAGGRVGVGRRRPARSRRPSRRRSWEVAWQSAGRTPDPWIGPDLLGRDPARRRGRRHRRWWSARSGFVSDHLEILYDLDIEAAGVAPRRRASRSRGPRPSTTIRGSSPSWPAWCERRAEPRPVSAASRRPTGVVVVGGGIAGLAAAWELVRAPGADGAPSVVRARRRRHGSGGKLRADRVRRPDRRPRRRRLPGPTTRGDRALRGARDHRRAGAGRGGRRVDLGAGPAAADARGLDPRGADAVVAARPVGDPRARPSRCGWPATWSTPHRGAEDDHRRPRGRRDRRGAPRTTGGRPAGRPADRRHPRRRRRRPECRRDLPRSSSRPTSSREASCAGFGRVRTAATAFGAVPADRLRAGLLVARARAPPASRRASATRWTRRGVTVLTGVRGRRPRAGGAATACRAGRVDLGSPKGRRTGPSALEADGVVLAVAPRRAAGCCVRSRRQRRRCSRTSTTRRWPSSR